MAKQNIIFNARRSKKEKENIIFKARCPKCDDINDFEVSQNEIDNDFDFTCDSCGEQSQLSDWEKLV